MATSTEELVWYVEVLPSIESMIAPDVRAAVDAVMPVVAEYLGVDDVLPRFFLCAVAPEHVAIAERACRELADKGIPSPTWRGSPGIISRLEPGSPPLLWIRADLPAREAARAVLQCAKITGAEAEAILNTLPRSSPVNDLVDEARSEA